MTMPEAGDLQAAVQDALGPITGQLADVLERVRKRLAQLALDPAKLQGPALAAIVADVLREMAGAATAARRVLGAGSERTAVTELRDAKQSRLLALSRSLAASDRPSLARALAMLRQAAAFGSGLEGIISDKLVVDDTAAKRREAQHGRFREKQVLMWVPERDACARCQRYAGLTLLDPRDTFPGGLSFDPAQQTTDAPDVSGPPLHPHCRCELQIIPRGDSGPASEALAREAQRSILKGWALESEGDASRRRAAKALVDHAQVPKSVKAEARKRLRETGDFNRAVPTGNESPAEKAFLRSYSGVYR
jgi:hypothetical protein